MKKIVTKNNIIYLIGNEIIVGEESTLVDGTFYGYLTISNGATVYEIDESEIPEFYLDECFCFDSTAAIGDRFILIPEKENQLLDYYINILKNVNINHYNIFKNKKYVDNNNNIFDASEEFYNFILSKKEEIENNIDINDLHFYTYNGKLFSGIQLLRIYNKLNEFYSACENKLNEISDFITNTITSYNSLSTITIYDIINKWPKTNQKLNLDGTISEIIANRFTLNVTTSKKVISADNNDSVDITFTLLYDNNLYSGADGISWYIPVINIDGNQSDLLEVILNNGTGTISWNTDKKGIYTIRMDLVRPIPKAILPENIEIIAK